MDKEMKMLLIKWGIGGAIVILFVPIAVNLLMLPKIGAAGQPDTWITFFGSYVGSILSGLLTLIGVLLTINYTGKQNKKNHDFTNRENRRNKLPEMIYSLEACLDFLEEKTAEAQRFRGEDILATFNTSPDERPLKMFLITKDYQIEMQKHATMITRLYLREIRNFTVKADIPAYDAFLRFKESLKQVYTEHISSISNHFSEFRFNVSQDYFLDHSDIIYGSDSYLNEIPLNEYDENRLIELKNALYTHDADYLNQVIEAYLEFEDILQKQLHSLVIEYNKG